MEIASVVYLYALGITALCTFALAAHIGNDRTLNPTSRRMLALSAIIMSVVTALEFGAVFMEGRPHFRVLFTIAVFLEIVLPPVSAAVESFAYGMRKVGTGFSAFIAVFTVIMAVLTVMGLTYVVDENGIYTLGSLEYVTTIYGCVYTVFILVILFVFSRTYKNRDIRLIVFMAVVLVASLFGSAGELSIAGYDGVSNIAGCLLLFLRFNYYQGLMHQEFESSIKEKSQQVEELSFQMVQALADAIDAKDRYTKGHSTRVTEYAVELGKRLGWDDEHLKILRFEALTHDVGKIGIPDSVLNKAGRLNDVEYGMIMAHTTMGSEILAGNAAIPGGTSAARSHHERYDGRGYPDHLAGKDIPENARAIAIADSFDAMNSDRIYRKALPRDVIRNELLKGAGTQFDPDFLPVFVELYDEGVLDEIGRSGRSDQMPQAALPEFNELARDFLEFFELKRECVGKWETAYENFDSIHHYVANLATQHGVDFEMAAVTVRPKDDAAITEEQQNEAIAVLEKAFDAESGEADVCARVTTTQIVVIMQRADGKDQLGKILRNALLYYYKIFVTDAFDISYEIVQ